MKIKSLIYDKVQIANLLLKRISVNKFFILINGWRIQFFNHFKLTVNFSQTLDFQNTASKIERSK